MAESDKHGLLPNRACRNCVQLKVKCIPLQGSSEKICHRCHRLGKTCRTPAPVPRRSRAKSNRVNQLEQRVERLTALLAPAQRGLEVIGSTSPSDQGPTSSTTQSEIPVTIPHRPGKPIQTSSLPYNVHDDEESDPWALGAQPIARSGSPSMFVPHIVGRKDGSQLLKECFCPVYLETRLENSLFVEFRSSMMQSFQFVVIDNTVSAAQFKRDRPFSYWACITAASYRDRDLHQKLNEEMMKALGHRMLVAGGKSIDLLQGTLLLAAWHHYSSPKNPQLMNLLHLAQALLADMGIGRPVRIQDKIRIASDTTAMMHGTETLDLTIMSEEKRALLGCYYLTSKAAFTFNRVNPMRYSQHIDDCCQSLKLATEYESDMILVELVHIHRIFGKYYQADTGSAITSSAYRSMLQDEIRQYRQSLASNLKENEFLDVEIYSNLVCFLEPNYSADHSDNVDRLHAIQACLDAGNKLLDIVTNIPSSEWPKRTFGMTMSIIQYLVVLCRLSFLKSENWSAEHISRTVNFGGVLQRLSDMFENIHQYEAVTYPDTVPWRFEMYTRKAQHIKAWYEAKMTAEEAAFNSAADEGIPSGFGDFFFEKFDDSIWSNVMGDWMDF